MASTPTPNRAHRPRDGRGKFTASLDTAERDAEACRLRVRGFNYADIAQALGYADRSHAKQGVERALRATVAEPAAHVRQLELDRLDAIVRRAWEVADAEHVLISGGRVVLDPGTGQPMRDHAPVLAAIDRLIRAGERRAKLLGLDAPTRIENIGPDDIDREIERLTAQLGLDQAEGAGW